MSISASQVAAFRAKTGLSMMDCKQALVECSGDEGKALEWLRAKGKGRAEKAATREAAEGRIGCSVDASGNAGIVEIRCETAPVSTTPNFIELATSVAATVAATAEPTPENIRAGKIPGSGKPVAEAIQEVFDRLRENIVIKRVARLSGHTGLYMHHNGQVGVIVEMSAACPAEVMGGVCMHIAAMNPQHARRDEVAAELVAAEKAKFAEEAKGKPAPVVEKIVEGKLGRWFSEFVLVEQPYVKEEGKRSVGEMLRSVSKDLTVKRFIRFQVGGA